MYIVGYPGEHDGPFVLHELHDLARLEARQEELVQPLADAEEHDAREAVDVKEGQYRHYLLIVREGSGIVHEHVQRLLHVGGEVAVAEHRALRDPGRAPCILERRHVFGRVYAYFGGGLGIFPNELAETGMTGLQALGLVREVHDHDVFQGGSLHHVLESRVNVRVDDDGLGARVFEDVFDLALHVHRVELRDYRPEPDGSEEANHVLRAVGEHERHPVALRYAAGGQRSCHLLGEGFEPGEVQRRPVERKGRLLAVLLDRGAKEIRQRTFVDLRLRGGVPLVDADPGLLRAEHGTS